MSSYFCEKCGAPIMDTKHGYITGCAHHPLTNMDAFLGLFQKLYDLVARNEIAKLTTELEALTVLYGSRKRCKNLEKK